MTKPPSQPRSSYSDELEKIVRVWDEAATGKRRHHIVPQFYLRAWVGESRELVVWDKMTGEVQQSGPKGVAHEHDAYRERVGTWKGSNFIEEALAHHENRDAPRVAAVLESLQDDGSDWPTGGDLTAMIDFALLMATRNPTERSMSAGMSDMLHDVDGLEPAPLAQQIFSTVASLRSEIQRDTIPAFARHVGMIPTSDHPSFIGDGRGDHITDAPRGWLPRFMPVGPRLSMSLRQKRHHQSPALIPELPGSFRDIRALVALQARRFAFLHPDDPWAATREGVTSEYRPRPVLIHHAQEGTPACLVQSALVVTTTDPVRSSCPTCGAIQSRLPNGHVDPPVRPGRNDPCRCGSSLKFKRCCLPA